MQKSQSDADYQLTLADLVKEIAVYGRRLRERNLAEIPQPPLVGKPGTSGPIIKEEKERRRRKK